MVCLKCRNEMTPVMKHGLQIDTCSVCGGVWLEKGVLGELLGRMRQAESSLDQELSRAQPQRPAYERTYYLEDDHHYRDPQHHDDHHDDHDHHKYGHKKRSIWDIFD